MTNWADFAAAAPALATEGRRLIERTGEAFLATVRADDLPRLHPIAVAIVDGHLLVFMIEGSPKTRDLADDGRYALHAHQDLSAPNEFSVRGRAREVSDAGLRAAALAGWAFSAEDGYRLFEFSIDHAVLGARPDADAWPPQYTSWRAASRSQSEDPLEVGRSRG